MTLFDYVFIIIGWLPVWFQFFVIAGISAFIIMLVVRFVVWIVEIIPGF